MKIKLPPSFFGNTNKMGEGKNRSGFMRFFMALSFLTFLSACAVGTTQSPPAEPTASRQPQTSGQPTESTRKVDPQIAERLQRIMVPLLQHMDKPLQANQVKIGLIENEQINAANAGNGEFYVTTGLLEKANDEALRGVLAHELAHEDLGHVAKTQRLGTGLNIGLVLLDQLIPNSGKITPLIADLGVMKPFTRREEYQADAHAVDILNKAGYNGKQIMANTLSWLMKVSGPSGGFLASHPGTEDRIERVRGLQG